MPSRYLGKLTKAYLYRGSGPNLMRSYLLIYREYTSPGLRYIMMVNLTSLRSPI